MVSNAIIESRYWKEELARIAKTLRPAKNPVRRSERAVCVIERDIMVGFFIVRRLIELHKVSSATRDHAMTVFSFPARGEQVTLSNNHRIDELYKLENERRESKKPLYLSNQFIHAYTSFVMRDERRNWSSVLIVSDCDRNDCIWRIPIEEIRSLFSVAAHDYPRSIQRLCSEKKGDYEVTTN
jgi:hypothetical protein